VAELGIGFFFIALFKNSGKYKVKRNETLFIAPARPRQELKDAIKARVCRIYTVQLVVSQLLLGSPNQALAAPDPPQMTSSGSVLVMQQRLSLPHLLFHDI
jgi:hypothetical protein